MKAESAVTGNCFGTIIGLSPNIIYYGRADDLPRRIILSAGPLTAEFETGDLRYIRLGDREIIRRIYAAVRDRNWRTISGQISDLTVNAAAAVAGNPVLAKLRTAQPKFVRQTYRARFSRRQSALWLRAFRADCAA